MGGNNSPSDEIKVSLVEGAAEKDVGVEGVVCTDDHVLRILLEELLEPTVFLFDLARQVAGGGDILEGLADLSDGQHAPLHEDVLGQGEQG
jgi:hypothetical protein